MIINSRMKIIIVGYLGQPALHILNHKFDTVRVEMNSHPVFV